MPTLPKTIQSKMTGKGFEFVPTTHSYFLNGKRLTGVTTVLSIISKPKLISWAARMACQYVRDNLKDIKELEPILELAVNAHAQKRDKAADAGSDIHAWIEEWIKDSNIALPEDSVAKGQAMQFVGWTEAGKVKFLESEKIMYSEKMFIGGTCDAVAEIDGKKYVVDFKTQAKMWDKTPHLQTAGYLMMLEEMGEKDFHGSLIILLPKGGKLEEHYDYDLETNKQGFLAALKLYRTLNS